MSSERWDAVDRYFADLFVDEDPALAAALRESDAAGLPAIQVSPAQGKFLQLLARSIGARRILEIGTLGGYSTICLGRALPDGGRLVTMELDSGHAKVARGNIARAGLADVVELREGPASESLAQLVEDGVPPFDFVFIDADKEGYPEYFEWALKLTREGGLIVADNVVRNGKVAESDCEDPRVQGVRRFNEIVAHESRVSATALQTVGSKGYDGFALVLVLGKPA